MLAYRLACLVGLFAAGHALADPPAKPKFDPGPWGAQPPSGDPKNPYSSPNITGVPTWGFVESTSKDGITLYRPAVELLHLRQDPVTGELLEAKKGKSVPAVPAKTFLHSDELAKGGYFKTGSESDTYRIKDVRVGDRVRIEYDRRNGVEICKAIWIDRRPGGQVPPASGEKPDAFRKHHERANADQNWEEFRTPYPRKYWLSYMKDGMLYEGPYPSESTVSIPIPPLPVVPAPRELKFKSSPG